MLVFKILTDCSTAQCNKECVLKSAVSIGSQYDTQEAMNHAREYLFGFYNYVLGFNARMTLKE